MKLSDIINHRVRGFRVVDVTALVVFLVLALTVYGFKTFSGRERADIVDVESQIRGEDRRVRLLQAELARLQSPARLERLAAQYAGQARIGAAQEVTPEALPQLDSQGVPAPASTP